MKFFRKENSVGTYAFVTEETLVGARDRVLDDLNALTDGRAEEAIRYVSEFAELDNILREYRERKEKEKQLEKQIASGNVIKGA